MGQKKISNLHIVTDIKKMIFQKWNSVLSKVVPLFGSPLSVVHRRGYKWTKTTMEKGAYVVEPTTMKVQTFDASEYKMEGVAPVITRYSTGGFNIQGNRVHGSVAVLPKGYFSWKPVKYKEITVESLQLFTVCVPAIEFLVIGTGDRIEFVSPLVRDYLRNKNISVEILDTVHAISYFNYLLEEDRYVAAALIPVS